MMGEQDTGQSTFCLFLEWNDILREKGILPRKELEITESQIEHMLETTIKEKTEICYENKNLDELDELLQDDFDDERILA